MSTGLRSLTMLAICCHVSAACREPDPSDKSRPEIRAYLAQLEEWRRDSAVIDSLSRLVNTDSMLAIKRAVLKTGNEDPYAQAMACQIYRLSSQHGFRPAELALERLDTAFTSAEVSRYKTIQLAASASVTYMNEAVCGPTGPRAPSRVHGVSLTEPRLHPIHPDSLKMIVR